MRRLLTHLLAIGVLASTAFVQGQTATKVAGAKGGATPEEAVAMINKAATAGDFDATFDVLVNEQSRPMRDWMKAQITLGASIVALADALDSAFGKDEASPIKRMTGDPKRSLARSFSNATVVGSPTKIDDETVSIQVKSRTAGPDGKIIGVERTMKAKKTPVGWKLAMDIPPNLDFPQAATIMDQARATIDRTTKRVKDGTVKDRAGAIIEVKKGLPKKPPENVPLPPLLGLPD